MTDEEIYKNISIAKSELNKLHLLASDNDVYMDLFYFPSIGRGTFYAQAVKSDRGYTLHTACTYYADYRGAESYAQTFDSVKTAEKHNAKVSYITVKLINAEEDFMKRIEYEIENYVPETIKNTGIVLDGVDGGARLYKNGSVVKTAIFHNSQSEKAILNLLSEFYRHSF
jgi:hypothetical protein